MRSVTSATRRIRMTAAVIMSAAILYGCESPEKRLNAPPQGQSDRPSTLQDNYIRMQDSAMLSERSVSSVHFVPGTSDLNGLGVRRLNRYATLLKIYGGPLHYDGITDVEALAKSRVDRIKDYLVAAGVGPDHFSVDVGLCGGTDMRASENSEIRMSTTAFTQRSDGLSLDKERKDIIEKGNSNEALRDMLPSSK